MSETGVAALGRVPSGIFILTMREGDQETGLLVSWVQQCSFDPPQITAVVGKDRPMLPWMKEDAAFVVNILGEEQKSLLGHFGKGFAPDEHAFEGLSIERSESGNVILTEALAHLECRVRQSVPLTDHHVIIAEVVDGNVAEEGRPMVHVRKSGAHY